jgi:hypothetical protein
MEYPGISSISENTSQKMYIGTDKINEIVNDLDSDGGSFSELSDSDTCKVNSPFSNSSEEVFQPEPDKRHEENMQGPS